MQSPLLPDIVMFAMAFTLRRGILGVVPVRGSSFIITSNQRIYVLVIFFLTGGVQIQLGCQDLSLPPGQ